MRGKPQDKKDEALIRKGLHNNLFAVRKLTYVFKKNVAKSMLNAVLSCRDYYDSLDREDRLIDYEV